jgi:hypothetical protein
MVKFHGRGREGSGREEEESTLTGGCLFNASIRGLLSSHKWGGSMKHPTGGEGRRQIPRGRTTPISSWWSRLAIPLGGVVEVAGAHVSPKVVPARVIGAGRNRRVTTVAIQSPERRRGWERGGGQGWAGSVWPTQTRASWFNPARWAGWADSPVGPGG